MATCTSKGKIYVLSLSSASPMLKRGKHRDYRVHLCEQIRNRGSHFDGAHLRHSVWKSGDAHETAHRLNHEVVAGAILIWAILTESCDRAVDQAEVQFAKIFVSKPVFGQSANLIGSLARSPICWRVSSPALAPWIFNVDRDRPLPTIARKKVNSLRGRATGTVGQGMAVPTPLCRPPLLDALPLSPQLPDREYLSGPWSSNDPAKMQHAKPSEAPSHFIRPQLNA